jgi:N-glycosylase/DNA lyase
MDKLTELKEYIAENKQIAVNHCKQVFDLTRYNDTEIFYRVIFCLLVPAGSAKKTNDCLVRLRQIDYINKSIDELSLYEILRPYIRFPRQKTVRLHSFKRSAKGFIRYLRQNYKANNGSYLRQALVDRVAGMGFKAASHFLRNMGVTDLAIIDTHILKYRPFYMPREKQDYLPSSPKKYLELEKYFQIWAQSMDLEPAYLDWLIWTKESGNSVTALDC